MRHPEWSRKLKKEMHRKALRHGLVPRASKIEQENPEPKSRRKGS